MNFKKILASMFPIGRGELVTAPSPLASDLDEWTMMTLWEWVEYVEEGVTSGFTPTPFCLRPFNYQVMGKP